MSQTPFSTPLHLKLHATGNFDAQTPVEALVYLDAFWPAPRTAHYRQARRLCQEAVEGLVDADTARRAVADAADRAGLSATRWEVDGQAVDTVYVSVASMDQLVDEVTASDFVGYYRAMDVVDDPSLAPSRKKAMLAFWASDANAVAGSPGLRHVRGVTVSIDSLFDAMARLDSLIDPAAMGRGTGSNPQASR